MTEQDIIQQVKEAIGAAEVYQLISTFVVHRNKGEGEPQEVTVKIFDGGLEANPSVRYYCVATGDDGTTATGNNAESIDAVLSDVHWGDLDRPTG